MTAEGTFEGSKSASSGTTSSASNLPACRMKTFDLHQPWMPLVEVQKEHNLCALITLKPYQGHRPGDNTTILTQSLEEGSTMNTQLTKNSAEKVPDHWFTFTHQLKDVGQTHGLLTFLKIGFWQWQVEDIDLV